MWHQVRRKASKSEGKWLTDGANGKKITEIDLKIGGNDTDINKKCIFIGKWINYDGKRL